MLTSSCPMFCGRVIDEPVVVPVNFRAKDEASMELARLARPAIVNDDIVDNVQSQQIFSTRAYETITPTCLAMFKASMESSSLYSAQSSRMLCSQSSRASRASYMNRFFDERDQGLARVLSSSSASVVRYDPLS